MATDPVMQAFGGNAEDGSYVAPEGAPAEGAPAPAEGAAPDALDVTPDTVETEISAADLTPEIASGSEDETPAAEATPESSDEADYSTLQLAEGFEVNDAALNAYVDVARDANVTPEGAQKMLDFGQEFVNQLRDEEARATEEAFGQLVGGWVEVAKADPEYGGAKYDESMANVGKALSYIAGTKYLAMAQDWVAQAKVNGLGAHPFTMILGGEITRQLPVGEKKLPMVGQRSGDARLQDHEVMYPGGLPGRPSE